MAYLVSTTSPVVVLLFILAVSGSSVDHYGDIRLYLNGRQSLNNTEGVIEVFINGIWGTVCIHGFNLASAAAACRQLGFINAIAYNTPMELNFQVPLNRTPILTDVECNDNDEDDLPTTGSLHILRCPNTVIKSGSSDECTTTTSIAAIQCDTTKLTEDPYEGQVRLIDNAGLSLSSGVAEIFLHDKWGTICYDGMTKPAADSFCRQLGYTNSSKYAPSTTERDQVNNEVPVWISETHCTTSQECFSQCIDYPKKQVSTGPCATNHSLNTYIECTYDRIHDALLSSGNVFECKISKIDKLGLAIGLSIALLTLFLVITIVGILAVCFTVSTCPFYAYRVKKKYTGLI